MSSKRTRRTFLRTTGTALAGVGLAGLAVQRQAWAAPAPCSSPAAAKAGWLIGVQQYTFRSMSCYEALEKLAALGIQHLEACFFLPLDKARPQLKTCEDLPADVRKEFKAKLADAGASMSVFYADLGADRDRAKRIFDFAKEMGAGTIVAEPPAAAFDAIEKLCDEYQIDLAVHNHPGPQSAYWKPENVLAVCQGRGKRIGACCDTGHWVRSGLDPVECLKQLQGRIRGFHLKDVIEKGKPEARDVPLGEGKADYAAVLKELKRQGYRGLMTIEYEHQSSELLQDVAKCVAFVEKWVKESAG